jgi:hypothetical protein
MEFRISRRDLLKSSAGNAVVSVVGIAGLMELLANREAIAAGAVIGLVGVTREPTSTEIPHRHTFSANFVVTKISPSNIMGNVSGRTTSTFSTGPHEEEPHFHIIHMGGVSLEMAILSGPEDNEQGGHMHFVSIE